VSYFFKWIPLVAIAALCILSLPWLGLIALFVVLAALVPLAIGIAYAPYRFGRAISHRWKSHAVARQRTADLHAHRNPYPYAAARRIDYRTPELGQATNSMRAGAESVLSQAVLQERDMP
jgi:hypothetical protein